MSENKFSLICLTFTGTLNQLHFTLLFTFTSFRTISYFSSSSHCFYGACLLACPKCTSVAACHLPAGARSSKFLVQISRLLTAETEPRLPVFETEPRLFKNVSRGVLSRDWSIEDYITANFHVLLSTISMYFVISTCRVNQFLKEAW